MTVLGWSQRPYTYIIGYSDSVLGHFCKWKVKWIGEPQAQAPRQSGADGAEPGCGLHVQVARREDQLGSHKGVP